VFKAVFANLIIFVKTIVLAIVVSNEINVRNEKQILFFVNISYMLKIKNEQIKYY